MLQIEALLPTVLSLWVGFLLSLPFTLGMYWEANKAHGTQLLEGQPHSIWVHVDSGKSIVSKGRSGPVSTHDTCTIFHCLASRQMRCWMQEYQMLQ